MTSTATAPESRSLRLTTLLRQVVLLGLLFVTMLVTVFGVTETIDQALHTAQSGNGALARSLAMVALGAPGFAVTLSLTVHRLRESAGWVTGPIWQLHVVVSVTVSLVGMMVGGGRVLEELIRSSTVGLHDVSVLLTWGAVWLIYWRGLVPRFEPRGDLHFAAVCVVGLVPMAIGQTGILHIGLSRAFDALAGGEPLDVRSASAGFGAMFLVGAAVWIGLWMRSYESAPRSDAWHALVVLVGTAVGFVAWLAAVARLGWLVAVWLVGDRIAPLASDHFDTASVWIGVGLTGGISFLYHRGLIGQIAERNDPVRVAEHLVLFASLVAAATGAVVLVSGAANPDGFHVNTVLAGAVTMAAGAGVGARLVAWMMALGRTAHGPTERASAVRRAYHLIVLGTGIVVGLFAGIDALQGVFEDLLDGDTTIRTFLLRRGELATVAVIVPTLWLHQVVLQQHKVAGQPTVAT